MRNFNYHRPSETSAAVDLLKASPEASVIAGGMTLLPTLKHRLATPSDLIDLAKIPALTGIKRDGNDIVIGAMTRHAEVAASEDVKSAIPALADLASGIADPAVRNRGTIGGSISNADPAADYPAAVVGLNATIVTTERQIAADDFFVGFFTTALEPGEIVTEIRFPIPEKARYLKMRHPASGYAVVGVMVARTAGGVRVAVTGAGPSAFRITEMEQALDAEFSTKAISSILVPSEDLMGDMHCSAEYRADMVAVFAKRAVRDLSS